MADPYAASPDDRFSFGLWTVGHRGSDPFGVATRPPIEPEEIVARLAEVGAWGVCFHDDDLVPFGSSAADRDRIVASFGKVVADVGMCVSMATVNLFTQPVFKDGAMTAADPAVRRFALRKACAAIDIGAELGAPIFVLWGGREGVETAAARDPRVALERYREGVNFLCDYVIDHGYDIRFALEAKPNEPRGHLYLPTTGHMLHFIEWLEHPEMIGVNPEMAHESMAGLSFSAAVGQALWADKLFHIDLNSQNGPRYDQDFRFGAEDIKEAFLTVRLLERAGYEGPRAFDARAYRSEDDIDVYAAFARGCIRNYKILASKAAAFDASETIREVCAAAGSEQLAQPSPAYSREVLEAIRGEDFSELLSSREGRHHEAADQLLLELLLGA
jgi:xylose isomerase